MQINLAVGFMFLDFFLQILRMFFSGRYGFFHTLGGVGSYLVHSLYVSFQVDFFVFLLFLTIVIIVCCSFVDGIEMRQLSGLFVVQFYLFQFYWVVGFCFQSLHFLKNIYIFILLIFFNILVNFLFYFIYFSINY